MYMCIWRWVGLVSVPGTAIVVQCSIVFNKHIARSSLDCRYGEFNIVDLSLC